MGKYSHLKDSLTPLPAEERFSEEGGNAFQDKVNKAKAEMGLLDLGMVELGTKFKELRKEKEAQEEIVKGFNVKLQAIEQVMLNLMETQGMSSFKLETGGNFIITDEPHTTVKDKQANRQWFIDHNMGEMLQVLWQTQNAMVKDILLAPIDPVTKQPRELPAGIDVHRRTSIQLRKK